MIAWLRRFVADAPRRKARRLERDARTVVEMVQQSYREPSLRAVASRTREAIAGTDAVDGEVDALERWHQRLRSLHAEARRSRDQVGLSALTLAIIDLQARRLGPDGRGACEAISAFLDASSGE